MSGRSDNMQKDTVLYKAMVKYRIKNLIYNIIVLVLLVMFTVAKLPYIKTEINGATPLDMERYLKETGTFKIDELIELTRHEPKEPESFYHKAVTYWQEDKYLFDIEIESAKKTDINFTSSYKIGENEYEYISAEVWYVKAGGRTFAVIANPDETFKNKLTGYLAEPCHAVMAPISQTLENGEEIVLSDYFIDCRGVEMGTANTDWALVKIAIVILLLLFIKLAIYYIYPKTTPTYRQLRRYGNIEDVADEVNRQAVSPEAYIEDKKLVTPDFILSNEGFKKKVVRNHMSKN